jgi:hypothetical protein
VCDEGRLRMEAVIVLVSTLVPALAATAYYVFDRSRR